MTLKTKEEKTMARSELEELDEQIEQLKRMIAPERIIDFLEKMKVIIQEQLNK